MDNLTHTAVALFLSRIGPGRWSPRATAVILIAANLPDIDVVTGLAGAATYLRFHRHLTHSLAAMPLMALAAVAIVRFAGRKPLVWRGAFFAALLAVASHLALDWTNVYGARLLLPFSSAWLRLDTTAVIDLWIWAACLLGIAAPFLGRLVGSEITSGSIRVRHHGRGWAWFVLALVLLFDCTRGALHSRAVSALISRLYQDAVPVRAVAVPDPVNPLRWRGLVETADAWAVEDLNLATDPGAAPVTYFHKPEAEPAIDAARRSPVFQQFLSFSQCPLWRVTPYPGRENARLVEVFDLRFGTPLAPGFLARAVVDSRLEVVESSVQMGLASRFNQRTD
ncbi:MAG TPA: metal-dependent hydrolase [Candidatus Acidoferrales bacterium]|nr:metal-dependent hydrolase [Candidatus Acidoferrales bacterium]